MKAVVLRGTKDEIVQSIVGMTGDVHEAIIFTPDVSSTQPPLTNLAPDIFAEMRPDMVAIDNVDDSRESIYSRMADE